MTNKYKFRSWHRNFPFTSCRSHILRVFLARGLTDSVIALNPSMHGISPFSSTNHRSTNHNNTKTTKAENNRNKNKKICMETEHTTFFHFLCRSTTASASLLFALLSDELHTIVAPRCAFWRTTRRLQQNSDRLHTILCRQQQRNSFVSKRRRQRRCNSMMNTFLLVLLSCTLLSESCSAFSMSHSRPALEPKIRNRKPPRLPGANRVAISVPGTWLS